MKKAILIQDLGSIYPSPKSKQKKRFGIFQCQCGNHFKAQTADVNNDHTKSCGCYRKKCVSEARTKHGLTNHRIYSTWVSMISRTTNPKHKKFSYYGGKGIVVCDRWFNVANFIEDMYPTYKEGLSIDRINNNGNYEPSNCRWATKEVQTRNTRKIYSSNTSGYRGVHFSNASKLWIAKIKIYNKTKHIGRFNSSIEAAKAYDTYVLENNLEHTINDV